MNAPLDSGRISRYACNSTKRKETHNAGLQRTLPAKELEITFLDAFSSTCNTDGMRALKALPFLSVVVCERGGYTVSLDGRPAFQVRAGQAFIAPAEVLQDITHHLDDQGAISMC